MAPASAATRAVAAEVEPLAATASGLVKAGAFKNTEEALGFLKSLNPEQAAAVAKQVGGAPAKTTATIAQEVGAARRAAEVGKALPESPLRPQRVQIGAEKTGRPLGLTKEEVRRQTGPVLGEALGEASPILPRQAHAAIVEKIKTLPRGPERDAYVALANAKARPQVENIRRTMEQLGFVLPVGLAGLLARQE